MRWLVLLLVHIFCFPVHAADEYVRGSLPAGNISVHVVSHARLQRICGKGFLACEQQVGRTCVIWLPEGIGLWGDPRTQWAGFADQLGAAEVAHELLHCAKGAWHP